MIVLDIFLSTDETNRSNAAKASLDYFLIRICNLSRQIVKSEIL